MTTNPEGASTDTAEAKDRKLFEDVVVRDGEKVTLHLDRLGADADDALDTLGVIGQRMADAATGTARGLLNALTRHIQSAHDEVKQKRAGAPPSS